MAGSKVQGSTWGQQEEEKESRVQGQLEIEERERESRAAAMVARENEKEKEKEGEGAKFGQQFFRVFFPQLYGESLRIPLSFQEYLRNQPTGVVSLKAQSGNTWFADLASDTQGLFFGNGWKEFVADHSLETGHFLTFRYDGRSKFSVVVFDGTCIEKPSAFHAKPRKDVVIKLENDEGDMDMNATDPPEIPAALLEESNESTRKRIREIDLNDTTLKKCSNVLQKGKQKEHGASVGSPKEASTSLNMDTNAVDQSEVPLEEINENRMKRVGEMGVNGSTLNMDVNAAGPSEVMVTVEECTRKRVREMHTDGPKLKKFSNVSEKGKQQQPGASVGTYKLASTSLNSAKDSDSPSRIQEESIPCNKSSKSIPLLLRMNKDVDKYGINIMTSQRQPAVVSQRPLVTEEQKNYALQKAKRFKSKNPFVLQIMKETNVYVGFFMKLPCKFVRKCLPQTDKNMKLWDPQGKYWEVNYIYHSELSSGAFSGGWSSFSLGNYLEKFDVCVFELFSKDNIKVHIYRVVPEITPFLPDPNRK